MQNLDFLICLSTIFFFTLLVSGILYNTKLGLEIVEIKEQKFSDSCNVAYISNFGIEMERVSYQKGWCLSPKTGASDFIYIWGW